MFLASITQAPISSGRSSLWMRWSNVGSWTFFFAQFRRKFQVGTHVQNKLMFRWWIHWNLINYWISDMWNVTFTRSFLNFCLFVTLEELNFSNGYIPIWDVRFSTTNLNKQNSDWSGWTMPTTPSKTRQFGATRAPSIPQNGSKIRGSSGCVREYNSFILVSQVSNLNSSDYCYSNIEHSRPIYWKEAIS